MGGKSSRSTKDQMKAVKSHIQEASKAGNRKQLARYLLAQKLIEQKQKIESS